MDTVSRFSLWFVMLTTCSTTHLPPIGVSTELPDSITISGPLSTTQDPRGQDYADEFEVVEKFLGDIFIMACPANWTALRNTSNGSRHGCESDGVPSQGSVCHITTLYEWMQGLYWCEHKDGTVVNLRRLIVSSDALILQPSVLPIIEGDDVVLTCRSSVLCTGGPRAPARFYKDDALLQVHPARQFTITGFSDSDAGLYWCTINAFSDFMSSPRKLVARKSAGNATVPRQTPSGSISATVDEVPVMTNNVIVLAGQNLVFSCNSTGNSSKEVVMWRRRASDGAQMCEECAQRACMQHKTRPSVGERSLLLQV